MHILLVIMFDNNGFLGGSSVLIPFSQQACPILNDEVSVNSIMKRATKHYTVVIKPQE